MLPTKSSCFFVALIAFVAAADERKCEKELNVSKQDWDELNKNPAEPAEKLLCFFKCEYERVGVLNADKTVDAEKFVEKVGKYRDLGETAKNEIEKCVQKLTVPVNNCPDTKPYHLCVHQVLKNEV